MAPNRLWTCELGPMIFFSFVHFMNQKQALLAMITSVNNLHFNQCAYMWAADNKTGTFGTFPLPNRPKGSDTLEG